MDMAPAILDRAKQLYAGTKGISPLLQTLRPRICPFEEILPLVPHGASVLDAGCGAGLFLGLLASSGQITHGLGFDSSHNAISLAQRMAANLPAGADISFQRLDATAEWPAGTYDIVTLVDVLHHVPPPFQLSVLSRAIERVRVGGLLLYKDMATRPRWMALCNRAHDLLAAREWIHYLAMPTVERYMAANGMNQIVKSAASRFCYAHEWALFQRPD